MLRIFRIYVLPSSEIWFCWNITRQNCLRLATKKSYIITRKPLFNSILHVPYTKLIFKYASLPNLNFRSLQCSKNLCAKTLCGPGNTVYHSAFLRQIHLILLAYSQTNSCIWLIKEAILGQAASPLRQKILDLEPYFTSILLKQFPPASQVKLNVIVFSTCWTDWLQPHVSV